MIVCIGCMYICVLKLKAYVRRGGIDGNECEASPPPVLARAVHQLEHPLRGGKRVVVRGVTTQVELPHC